MTIKFKKINDGCYNGKEEEENKDDNFIHFWHAPL